MKKILIISLLMISGCVSAKYNPKTGLISYDRVGNMDASEIEITLPGETSVKVGSLKNTGFNQIVEAISKAYQAGLAAGAAGVMQ